MKNKTQDSKKDITKSGEGKKKSYFSMMSFVFDGDVESAEKAMKERKEELDAYWEEQRLKNLHGYIDEDGNEIVPRRYHEVREPSEDMIAVRSYTRWGFYNIRGELVIPFDYTHAFSFSEGLAGVRQKGKYGFIDKSGRVVIPFRYSYVGCFSEGMAKVSINDKWGYINRNGEVMIPIQSKKISSDFHEGLAWGWGPQGGVGFFDKHGNVVIPYEYERACSFCNGLAAVRKDNLWGMINKENEVIVPFEYMSIGSPKCGRILVEKDGKYVYLDEQGNVAIDIKYDNADEFDPEEGSAWVEIDGKSGYINREGEVIEWDY